MSLFAQLTPDERERVEYADFLKAAYANRCANADSWVSYGQAKPDNASVSGLKSGRDALEGPGSKGT